MRHTKVEQQPSQLLKGQATAEHVAVLQHVCDIVRLSKQQLLLGIAEIVACRCCHILLWLFSCF